MIGLAVLLLFVSAVSADIDNTTWPKYIYGPKSLDIYPVSVVMASDNVYNPDGLLPGGQGDTMLTRAEGEEPPVIVLAFELNTVGFLNIQFNGASSNTPGIRLAFSETMQFLTDLSDYSRSNMANPITPGSDQIAVRSTPYTWTDTLGCENGTQVCSDGLHGFKYLKIYLDALDSDAPIVSKYGTVNISSVSLKYSAFLPTQESFLGWFECSDEQLNQYWYAAVYTNDLTTDTFRATDVDPRGAANAGLEGRLVLFDGAKRDRDPYVGDVAVSGRTTYLSHGILSAIAARNVLADLGDHQRDDGWVPPASVFDYTLNLFDYPLWWVIAVWDYVLYTGDDSLIQSYFPHMVRVFEDYYPAHTNETSNLIVKPNGMGDYAFVGRDGEASYYNALYVLALKVGAESANFLGNSTIADRWLDRAHAVSTSFNEVFWDESVGAYLNRREDLTSHPQDGNSLAVLAGISNRNRTRRALSYLAEHNARPYGNAFMDDDSVVGGGSQRVYAFMSTFELRALFEADMEPTALSEIFRLYGWMHTHDPEVTYWEGVGGEGSMYQGGFTSAAHGWSTGIAGILVNYVLGLIPMEPGGTGWLIQPKNTPLDFARGQVSTTFGAFLYEWAVENSTYKMEIDSPVRTKSTVVIPVEGAEHYVTHNGEEIWRSGIAMREGVKVNEKGHVVLENVLGGKHVIKAIKQKNHNNKSDSDEKRKSERET